MAESDSTKTARDICEATLKAERSDLIEKKIWPSRVAIIDRLLDRGLELQEAYEELNSKIGPRPHALRMFFELLETTAAFSHPEANIEARKGRDQLAEVNRQIEEIAGRLAELLHERQELGEHSGFTTDTLYHPLELINIAARNNYLHQGMVKGELAKLRARFDLKYWPGLDELASVIAEDAARAIPQAIDEGIAAGTEGSKPSLADTFKVFFVELEEQSLRNHGFLPNDFQLTDRSVASLLSCALDLQPDDVVDAAYVKRLRQRERERHSA